MILNISSKLSSVFINFISERIPRKQKELFANDFAEMLLAASKGGYYEGEYGNLESLLRDVTKFVDVMFTEILLFSELFSDEIIEINLYNDEDDVLVDIIPDITKKSNGSTTRKIDIAIHSEIYGDKLKTLKK